MFWPFVFMVVVSEAAAVYYLKQYSQTNYLSLLFLSMILYFSYAYALARLFKIRKIAVSQAITGMLSLVSVTLLGYVLHNESVTRRELFGLMLALISIGVLL